jgi:hypothetical protein
MRKLFLLLIFMIASNLSAHENYVYPNIELNTIVDRQKREIYNTATVYILVDAHPIHHILGYNIHAKTGFMGFELITSDRVVARLGGGKYDKDEDIVLYTSIGYLLKKSLVISFSTYGGHLPSLDIKYIY